MIGDDSIIQMNFLNQARIIIRLLIGELCQCFECSNWNQGDKLSSVCFHFVTFLLIHKNCVFHLTT